MTHLLLLAFLSRPGKDGPSVHRVIDDQNARTVPMESIAPTDGFVASGLAGPPNPTRWEEHGEILRRWAAMATSTDWLKWNPPILCGYGIDNYARLQRGKE